MDTEAPPLKPANAMAIFWVFSRMALQGFGGVLAVAQRELVDRARWMTREQFLEAISISQVLPGPNIINLALKFGDEHFRMRGAMAAMFGLLAFPLAIVLTAAALYTQFHTIPMVAGALRGMGAVAAGLVIGTAVKLASTIRKNPLGLPTCGALAALMFAGMAIVKWPMWIVLGTLGPIAMALAWRKLARKGVVA